MTGVQTCALPIQLTVPNDNPSDAKVRFSVIIYVDMLLDYKGSVSFCNFSHAFNNHELFIHAYYFLFNVHYTVIITMYYVQWFSFTVPALLCKLKTSLLDTCFWNMLLMSDCDKKIIITLDNSHMYPYGLNQICLVVSLYTVVLFQPWKIEYIYELLISGITEYIYE